MEKAIIAKLKYLRIAPRKTRLLANTLKGLSVNNAEAQLMVSARRAARPLLKLLRSATANAKNNAKLDPNKMFVKEIRVDLGPKSKRWTPRARGSASPIEKKTSHVSIILESSQKSKEPKFTFREKPKKVEKPQKKQPEETDKFKKEEKKSETKFTKTPNFFQKVFRRKSI